MSYWTCVVARNAASHLSNVLDSLLQQTLKPSLLVTVDDGSNDATRNILADYASRYSEVIQVLTLPDNGYDIRRVPRNINLASNAATKSGLNTDFLMVSGDDCSYPADYALSVISRMISDPGIAVASGRPSSAVGDTHEHSPSGSGRVIRCSFWREVGGKYPTQAGWETWLLYKALEKGHKVRLFKDLIFEHVRPRGAKHQFVYWGAAMHTLGYHPLYAIGRIAKNLFERKMRLTASVNLFRGYLLAQLGSSDPFMSPFEQSFRSYVRTETIRKIARLVAVPIGALTQI